MTSGLFRGHFRRRIFAVGFSFGFDLGNVALSGCRERLPDFYRDHEADNSKRHDKNRPPAPVVSRDVAENERLQSTADVGKSVDDARTGGGGLSSTKIG